MMKKIPMFLLGFALCGLIVFIFGTDRMFPKKIEITSVEQEIPKCPDYHTSIAKCNEIYTYNSSGCVVCCSDKQPCYLENGMCKIRVYSDGRYNIEKWRVEDCTPMLRPDF